MAVLTDSIASAQDQLAFVKQQKKDLKSLDRKIFKIINLINDAMPKLESTGTDQAIKSGSIGISGS